MKKTLMDLTGKTFGRITVIKRLGTNKNKKPIWKCKCQCGKIITMPTPYLTTGDTKSCGCLRVEMTGKKFRTHGLRGIREYSVWGSMVQRCTNEKNNAFENYGGRGIGICKRWMSFKNFISDMGVAPKGMTIERINNQYGYRKSNCRWATQKEQCNNRRTNKLIEFNGKTKTAAQWYSELGLNKGTFISRLRRGWTIKKTIETGVRLRKKVSTL